MQLFAKIDQIVRLRSKLPPPPLPRRKSWVQSYKMFILFTGDIAELRDSVKIDDEHIAAFSDECSTMSKRFSLIDVSENAIAAYAIEHQIWNCSFLGRLLTKISSQLIFLNKITSVIPFLVSE